MATVSEFGAVITGDIDANSKTDIIGTAKSCGWWFMWNFEPCMSVYEEGKYEKSRNGDGTITKKWIIIDNTYIVLYDSELIKKHQAHLNIEWCNQNTCIKYLFKYVNEEYVFAYILNFWHELFFCWIIL